MALLDMYWDDRVQVSGRAYNRAMTIAYAKPKENADASLAQLYPAVE